MKLTVKQLKNLVTEAFAEVNPGLASTSQELLKLFGELEASWHPGEEGLVNDIREIVMNEVDQDHQAFGKLLSNLDTWVRYSEKAYNDNEDDPRVERAARFFRSACTELKDPIEFDLRASVKPPS